VQFVEQVTGIEGLLQDPQLKGGGMHEIPDGGHFAAHVDFNRHLVTGLHNRLVIITYLNKNWRRFYGGSLELWDYASNVKAIDIDPVFGRTVIFTQSSESLHGHSVPVQAPDRRPRQSVAAYFYTKESGNVFERT
jgi:Rps23 Pro-64 3,4-dihydroxylase Tpa1-like proline 4-hydroxylase